MFRARGFRQSFSGKYCKICLMNKIVYEINVDIIAIYAFLLQFYLLLLLVGKDAGKLWKIAGISALGVCVDAMVVACGFFLHPSVIVLGMVLSIILQMRLVYGKVSPMDARMIMKRSLLCFLCMGGGGMIYLSVVRGGGILLFWCFLQMLYMALTRLFSQSTSHVCTVRLFLGEEVFTVQALYDTGNRLYEPISGKYVCIVKEILFEQILEKRKDIPIRYIPYRSMGKAKGVLQGIVMERMEVLMDGIWREKRDFYIARGTKDAMSEEYDMILHERAR